MSHVPSESRSSPVALKRAQGIRYESGGFFFTAEGAQPGDPADRLPEEEIALVLKAPNGDQGYVIYCLSESADGHEDPFTLSALATPTLPQELLDRYLLAHVPAHLISDETRQLHVIISTKSGVGKAPRFHEQVIQPLLGAIGLRDDSHANDSSDSAAGEQTRDLGYQVTVTQNSQTVREFARHLQSPSSRPAGRHHTILLLSGDGGIVDLLNGRDETPSDGPDSLVCLFPLGTGNALFHSLHRPQYLAHGDPPAPSPCVLGLRTLFRGHAAPLPAFRASFSPRARLVTYADPDPGAAGDALEEPTPQPVEHLVGAIVASYGFHASLVWESDTPEYRRHGARRFGMAAQELLKLGRAYDASVEVVRCGEPGAASADDAAPAAAAAPLEWARVVADGQGRFTYVLATMVSSLEKTFTISPASRPLDGQLRLVHFGDVGGERTMEVMMAAYQDGAHVGLTWDGEDGGGGPQRRVGYEPVEALRVTIREEDPRWRKVCIDGTIVEIEQGGWMEVRRADKSHLGILVDTYDA